jgi:hypothetical protein
MIINTPENSFSTNPDASAQPRTGPLGGHHPGTLRQHMIFVALCVLCPALVWLWPLNWWVGMNFFDTGNLPEFLAFFAAIVGFGGVIPWAVVGVVLLFGKRTFLRGFLAMFAAVASLISAMSAREAVYDVRLSRLAGAGVEAKPLIGAIRAYEADNHEPPSTLQALVPRYLTQVPGTGIPAYPEFLYSPRSFTPPNQWELSIPCAMGMGFDQFL